jgi:hypothetical protein
MSLEDDGSFNISLSNSTEVCLPIEDIVGSRAEEDYWEEHYKEGLSQEEYEVMEEEARQSRSKENFQRNINRYFPGMEHSFWAPISYNAETVFSNNRELPIAIINSRHTASCSSLKELRSEIARRESLLLKIGYEKILHDLKSRPLDNPFTDSPKSYDFPHKRPDSAKPFPLTEVEGVEVSSVDKSTGQRIFDILGSKDYIPFDYNVDNCQARAHEIAFTLENLGITTGKVFIYPTQEKDRFKVASPYALDGMTSWGLHIAPFLVIDGKVMVIDPSLASNPLETREWQNLFTSHNPSMEVKIVFSSRFNYRGPDENKEEWCQEDRKASIRSLLGDLLFKRDGIKY